MMAERIHKETTRSRHETDEVTDDTVAAPQKADLTDTDALLDEIDALLQEDEAEQQAAAERKKAEFKEKIRSLGFFARRSARRSEPVCIGCIMFELGTETQG